MFKGLFNSSIQQIKSTAREEQRREDSKLSDKTFKDMSERHSAMIADLEKKHAKEMADMTYEHTTRLRQIEIEHSDELKRNKLSKIREYESVIRARDELVAQLSEEIRDHRTMVEQYEKHYATYREYRDHIVEVSRKLMGGIEVIKSNSSEIYQVFADIQDMADFHVTRMNKMDHKVQRALYGIQTARGETIENKTKKRIQMEQRNGLIKAGRE